jgi:hypothetical protein
MSHAAFGHMIAHMVLRGLVYGVIWKVLHQLRYRRQWCFSPSSSLCSGWYFE